MALKQDGVHFVLCPKQGTSQRMLSQMGYLLIQRTKKVMSDSLGLEGFVIGLVIFVLNLPYGQVLIFGKIQFLQKDCNQFC